MGFLIAIIKAIPWILKDMFTRKDKIAQFNTYARIDILVGKTGSGKTISAIEYALRMKKRFPDLKILSNVTSPLFDGTLDRDILRNYAEQPEMVIIDEANTTFPAKLKTEVDDDLRHYLTQVRKGAGRYILLLTQDYSMIDTNYRKLARYVYDVHTYAGRATIVRRFRQEDFETYSNAGGINTFAKGGNKIKRLTRSFVQTKKLRSKYDYKEKVRTDWFKVKREETKEVEFV